MKKGFIVFILMAVLTPTLFFFGKKFFAISPDSEKLVAYMYKDPNCGCCDGHAEAVEKDLGIKVEKKNTKQLALIKAKFNIAPEMQSCHTLVFGDKFAEGHVPTQELRKFFFEGEYQDYQGISLPGMPIGTPGMPGPKTEIFRIYGIDESGAYTLEKEI